MNIVENVSDISIEEVDAAEAYLLQILRESYPTLDLTKGRVLEQILLRPAAVMQAIFTKNEEVFRASASLLRVAEDPEGADPEILDELMSNYRISRDTGSYGLGNVTFVFTDNNGIALPEGYLLTSNGVSFATLSAHSIFSSEDFVTADSDRYFIEREDGAYQFTIPVQATTVGSAGKLKRDDDLTPTDVLVNFVQAYAEEDFIGGDDPETNEDLVAKASDGISAKILSGRDQIEALLKEQLTSLKAVSVVGFGDSAMLRDRHNIFQMSTGGCVDIYVKTEEYPITTAITYSATLVNKTTGTWQMTFDRTQYPGMYNVEYIRPVGDATLGSYTILSQTKSLDLTSENAPDLENLTEGAYSAYQTLIVQFTDTAVGDLSVGDTRDYKVGVFWNPYIDILQEYVNDRGTQNPNASYLVRAFIPCTTSISMIINRTRTDPSIDVEAIKLALLQAINGVGFGIDTLESTFVAGTVDALLPGKAVVDSRSLEMRGAVLAPDGTVLSVSNNVALEIPNRPDLCVTPRTCMFTCNPNSISISVQTVESVDV